MCFLSIGQSCRADSRLSTPVPSVGVWSSDGPRWSVRSMNWVGRLFFFFSTHTLRVATVWQSTVSFPISHVYQTCGGHQRFFENVSPGLLSFSVLVNTFNICLKMQCDLNVMNLSLEHVYVFKATLVWLWIIFYFYFPLGFFCVNKWINIFLSKTTVFKQKSNLFYRVSRKYH